MLRQGKPVTIRGWRGIDTFSSKEEISPDVWFDGNNVLVNSKGQAEALRSPKAFGDPVPAESSESSESSPDGDIFGLSEYARTDTFEWFYIGGLDPTAYAALVLAEFVALRLTGGQAIAVTSAYNGSRGVLNLPPDAEMEILGWYNTGLGHALIIDKGDDTYVTIGGTPTLIRSGQAGDPWTSLTINNRFQRIDGNEFIQILTDFSVRRNGIDAPTVAPVISYAAESSESSPVSESSDETESVSLQGSYAYRNSTTRQVSGPSPLSNVLGPTAGSNDLSWTVTASAQTGVDQIVFFLTVDGGSVPYLVIDCDDVEMHTEANATATVTFTLSEVDRDTLTPEPIYNLVPPTDATFMFPWGNRILLVVDGQIRYSSFEACYIGNPYESWPALNNLIMPDREVKAVGGIGTQVGALVFGDQDSFLIGGSLSDKTSGPNNTIAVTEQVTSLQWRIGIKYPKTAIKSPFGVIWVDQVNRIQNWNLTGYPIEIGMPFRSELDAMGTLEAKWFQHGKNGGYYVLTDGTTTLIIMLFVAADGKPHLGYGKTDLPMDAISPATFATERFFFADGDQIYELLDPDLEGDGWAEDTEIFFKIMLGNDLNFSSIHSMQMNGDINGLAVTVSASDGTDEADVILEDDLETGGSVFGIVDSTERRRHIMNFAFNTDDSELRTIRDTTIVLRPSQRII